jgi:hypothetical protein
MRRRATWPRDQHGVIALAPATQQALRQGLSVPTNAIGDGNTYMRGSGSCIFARVRYTQSLTNGSDGELPGNDGGKPGTSNRA